MFTCAPAGWVAVICLAAAAARCSGDTPPASSPAAKPPAGPSLPPGFVVKTLDTGERTPRQYIVFTSGKYRPDRKWPVLIFLHGSGESGNNTIGHTTVGLGPYIAGHRLNDFPFVTIFPQVPAGPRVLENFLGEHGDWIWRMLDAVQKEYSTDPDRVYMTGLSMGGFGTWDLAMEHPDRLAAIAPLCGGSTHIDLVANLVQMPVWAFHGSRDDRVPPESTRRLVDALTSAGGKPKYVEYPDLFHNCWDRTYANLDLYKWLLRHKRNPKPDHFGFTLPTNRAQMSTLIWWFQFEEVEPITPTTSPHVDCSIKPGGKVVVNTQAVLQGSLISALMPVKPGNKLTVEWNGRTIFQGAAADDLMIKLKAPQPATRKGR